MEILLWSAALMLFVAGAVAGIKGSSGLHLAGILLRVIAVLLLVFWAAFLRRKLTPWIIVAMFAGIEIGVDAPTLAVNMHFLSDIFSAAGEDRRCTADPGNAGQRYCRARRLEKRRSHGLEEPAVL